MIIVQYDSKWYGNDGELMSFIKGGVKQIDTTGDIRSITLDIKDFMMIIKHPSF